jgi:hypothetical protein
LNLKKILFYQIILPFLLLHKMLGLGRDEIYDVINLTLAVDAALVIGTTNSPLRQNELLRTMSKPQQALTIDVLNAIYAQGRSEDGSIGYRKVSSQRS